MVARCWFTTREDNTFHLVDETFAMVRTPSPARETRALPRICDRHGRRYKRTPRYNEAATTFRFCSRRPVGDVPNSFEYQHQCRGSHSEAATGSQVQRKVCFGEPPKQTRRRRVLPGISAETAATTSVDPGGWGTCIPVRATEARCAKIPAIVTVIRFRNIRS